MSSRPQPSHRHLTSRQRMPAPNLPSPPSASRRWTLTPLKRGRLSAGRGRVSITIRGLTSARTSSPSGRVAGRVRDELCWYRRYKRLGAHDVPDAREIVRQHVQCHLGGNPWQRLRQEVGCSHWGLDRAEQSRRRIGTRLLRRRSARLASLCGQCREVLLAWRFRSAGNTGGLAAWALTKHAENVGCWHKV